MSAAHFTAYGLDARAYVLLCAVSSGFVDSYGALVEDFAYTRGRVYTFVWFILLRIIVGAVAGMATGGDEDKSRLQIKLLAGVFTTHLLLLVALRPFLVPLATFFARRDSAEDFSRLNALLFTAMAWIFIPAHRFALP